MEHPILKFPIHVDERGLLVSYEFGELPFEPKRLFVLSNVPEEAKRGGHAHRSCKQVVVALSGSVKAILNFGSHAVARLQLRDPSQGLFVPEMTWLTLEEFTPNAIVLVFCSEPYRESDYLRVYTDYVKLESSLQQPCTPDSPRQEGPPEGV